MKCSLNHKMAVLFVVAVMLMKSSALLSAKIAYLLNIQISPKDIEFLFLMIFLFVGISIFFGAIEALSHRKASNEADSADTHYKDTVVHLYNAPGFMYINIGQFLLTKKAYSRIMKESILNMQEEYFEYIQEDKIYYASWVKVRYFFVFLFILGINLPLIRQLIEIKSKIAK